MIQGPLCVGFTLHRLPEIDLDGLIDIDYDDQFLTATTVDWVIVGLGLHSGT